MSGDAIHDLREQVRSLRKQTRILQCCLVATVAGFLIADAPHTAGVLRAKGLIIEDGEGRPRILLGDTHLDIHPGQPRGSGALVFRSEGGQDRILIGQEPDPELNGKVYRRVAPGWGMLINAPDGTERGGFGYLDGRGASISIDRPTGDAMGMLVDEKSGLSTLVVNYDNNGNVGSYPTALEVGTKGQSAFVDAFNRDGTSAGSIATTGVGRAALSSGKGVSR